MEKYIVALDVGGTKVMAGLLKVNTIQSPKIVLTAQEPTSRTNLNAVKDQISRLFSSVVKMPWNKISGIGIALPGPIDYKKGLLLKAPNLPGWDHFPIRSWLEKKYGRPVKIENDANAAALGEAIWGAGKNKKYVFYATISTGIGTGLVIEKQLYTGFTGMALEGGHLIIDYQGRRCGCGLRGCIEAYASGPSMAKRAQELWPKLKTEDCSPPALLKNIQSGSKKFIPLINETGRYLGIWLGNIVNLLDPEIIVLGGGITNFGEQLFKPIRNSFAKFSINPKAKAIPVVKARLNQEVGIYGAAALFAQKDSSH